MQAHKTHNRELPFIPMILSTGLLFLLVFFMPKNGTFGWWGFFFYDNFSTFSKLLFILSPLLLTIICHRPLLTKLAAPAPTSFFRLRNPRLTYFLIFIISFLFFWALREHRLWGDARPTILILEGKHPETFLGLYFWKEPLDRLCAVLFYKSLNHLFGWGAAKSIALMNCLCGSMFVITLLTLARRLGRNYYEKFFLFCFTISMGSVQLFFGHIENYTLVTLFILLFINAGINYLKGKQNLTPAFLFAALAVATHGLAVFLLPGLLALLLIKKDKKMIKCAVPGILFLIVFYIFCRLLGAPPFQLGLNRFADDTQVFLNLTQALQREHLWNVLQRYIISLPLGFFLVFACYLSAKDKTTGRNNPLYLFLAVNAVSFFIYALFFHEKLGWLQDWDLLAPAALLLTLWSAFFYAQSMTEEQTGKTLGIYIIFFSLSFTIPWILSNLLGG